MQNLKRLIDIINSKGEREIVLFEEQFLKPGKELSLFQGITSGQYKSEHSAAAYLYQSEPKDIRYSVLKTRLEEKLLNFLIFIKLNDKNSSINNSIEGRCQKELVQVHILCQLGELQIGERLLKKVLRTAKTYEFTGIIVESLELLLDLYTHKQASSDYYQTKQEFIYFQEILSSEQTARILYQEAQLKFPIKQGIELNYLADAVSSLLLLWKKTNSFNCFDLYYRLYVQQLELEGKYQELFVLTSLSKEFLQDLKINSKRFNNQYNIVLMIYSSLRTGDVKDGLKIAKESCCFFDSANFNWITFYESYFLLSIHAPDYILASKLIEQVEQNTSLLRNLLFIKEKWNLYKLYYDWLCSEKKFTKHLEDTLIKQQMPTCYKDKQGYKIPILIMQFCHNLFLNRKEFLSEKAEFYKKYMERHLQNDLLIRERIFFLLILLIIRHNFRYDQISKKAGRLLKQLKQCILPGGACISKFEIVPYEYLWESIMNILSNVTPNKLKLTQKSR